MSKTVEVTDSDYEAVVVNSEIPVLVDFWAPWCGPCQTLGPVLEELAEEYEGRVKICKINVDENEDVAGEFNIRSIPFLALVKDGEMVTSKVGASSKSQIQELLTEVLDN